MPISLAPSRTPQPQLRAARHSRSLDAAPLVLLLSLLNVSLIQLLSFQWDRLVNQPLQMNWLPSSRCAPKNALGERVAASGQCAANMALSCIAKQLSGKVYPGGCLSSGTWAGCWWRCFQWWLQLLMVTMLLFYRCGYCGRTHNPPTEILQSVRNEVKIYEVQNAKAVKK